MEVIGILLLALVLFFILRGWCKSAENEKMLTSDSYFGENIKNLPRDKQEEIIAERIKAQLWAGARARVAREERRTVLTSYDVDERRKKDAEELARFQADRMQEAWERALIEAHRENDFYDRLHS